MDKEFNKVLTKKIKELFDENLVPKIADELAYRKGVLADERKKLSQEQVDKIRDKKFLKDQFTFLEDETAYLEKELGSDGRLRKAMGDGLREIHGIVEVTAKEQIFDALLTLCVFEEMALEYYKNNNIDPRREDAALFQYDLDQLIFDLKAFASVNITPDGDSLTQRRVVADCLKRRLNENA